MAKKMFNVKNRSASTVIYNIPEINVRREFAPGETKRLAYEELEKLSYQPGGRSLMANFLQTMEDGVNDSLNIHTEDEYYMSEQQIIDLLKFGTLDEFKDCLDFAPIGVIDLVKQFATQLPLTDTLKISALRDKTGFDVEKALANSTVDKAASVEQPVTASTTGRRTTPKYKVVSKAESPIE